MSAVYSNTIRKIIYNTSSLVSTLVPIPVTGFIFCYHSISNDNWDFSVPEDTFKKQIDHLLANFIPFSLDDLEAYIKGEITVNRPFFVITFDDGYKNILTVKDYLVTKGIKPVSFVISDSDKVDRIQTENNLPFLSLADIRDLHIAGWDIGCHSQTHTDFWKITTEKISQEILYSKLKLERDLSIPIDYFAYPKGRYTIQIKEAVQNAGYKMAFSMDNTLFTKNVELMSIPRVGVMRTHTFSEFKALTLGLSTKVRSVLYKKTGDYNEL